MNEHEHQAQRVKQQIQGIFDRAASTYDQVGARFFTHFGRRMVEVAQLAPGDTVLDVATGRGAVLFPAAAAVAPTGQVTGIDFAAQMIEATRADAVAREVTNIELHQMDAENLAYADATFDVVLCGFALFMLPRIDHALAEMRRVLRPGGRIAVSTWVDVFGPEGAWLRPLQTQFQAVPQNPARTASGEPLVFDTPEGLHEILSRAGFTAVQVIPDQAQFWYADAEEWWDALWSHGMRGWLEALKQQQGHAALERFREAAFAQLHAQRTPQGIPQSSSVLFGIAERPGD